MAAFIPQTMKALIVQADKTAKVQEVPVPEIDEWEILVKVVAVAQNPTDWKCKYSGTSYSCIRLTSSALRSHQAV